MDGDSLIILKDTNKSGELGKIITKTEELIRLIMPRTIQLFLELLGYSQVQKISSENSQIRIP
jgi:hypothetical protein